ncbi:hypothetical protein NQ317_019666 [Molorchus minor]|uniref:Uncharacterized protein n=1 Tax=Molorchus minor TaxID=1323400 RepID=A0ABQ9JLD1_9CUCU|nr:hypothetical protein NQ317_019666 [Molorchus minor]
MCFLKILYGPYEAHGLIKHRFQKLRGLYECLSKLGYEIELIQINLLNRLSIEMADRIIYRCNIRYLSFNMDCNDDNICERAVFAIEEAKSRMLTDKNIPKYFPISKGRRHIAKMNLLSAQEIISEATLWHEFPHKWNAT